MVSTTSGPQSIAKNHARVEQTLHRFLHAHDDVLHPLVAVKHPGINRHDGLTETRASIEKLRWRCSWAANSEQCQTAENQDGWMAVLPRIKEDYESILHHRRGDVVANTSHRDFIAKSSVTFGVFDGHGVGGRVAASEAAEGMSNWILQTNGTLRRTESILNNQLILDQMVVAFKQGDLWAHQAAIEQGLDCGTTAIVHSVYRDEILTAWTGDSEALLVVTNAQHERIALIQLMVPHKLDDQVERDRIGVFESPVKEFGGGRIVIGVGNVERLIPKNYSYTKARQSGLSINMSRALGHRSLRHCGISPLPDITSVSLLQLHAMIDRQRTENNWMNIQLKRLTRFYRDPCFASRSFELYKTVPLPSPTKIESDDTSARTKTPDVSAANALPMKGYVYHILSYSDGVGDVLNISQLGELVVQNLAGSTAVLAEKITQLASAIRLSRSYRADNCTCSVLKFEMDEY